MKERIQRILSRIHFSKKSAPFAFLALLLLTFGIYIPLWGFYWDDWPSIYITHTHGNFWQYVQSDRPLSAWPDVFFGAILGVKPLYWHILYLLLWWAVVLAFWWCLKLIWPKAERQAFCAALLFSVYPIFFQQAIAGTYVRAILNYALCLTSIILMLLAIRKPRRFYVFTIFSLMAGAVQLVSLEYFWGLELLRPVLLWIVLAEVSQAWKVRLKKVVLRWLPYLVLFVLVLAWRFFSSALTGSGNSLVGSLGGSGSLLSTIENLAQGVFRDILNILVSTWSRTVDPQTIQFAGTLSWASWGLVLVVVVGAGLYLWRMNDGVQEKTEAKPVWANQAIPLGVYALLVGMIPIWATGHAVYTGGMYADRWTLPAMIGASLLITGLVYKLVTKWSHRALILAILVGLSSGVLFRVGNDYRWDWTEQTRFYWQLYWRAPAVKPGTAFLSEGGIFQYVTEYSLATAIDNLYPVPDGTTDVPYWAYELDNLHDSGIDATALLNGVNLNATARTLSFQASSLNSIVVSFQLNKPHCLWVVTAADANYPYLRPYTAETLNLTNLDRIMAEPTRQDYPDPGIFGAEPQHTWCYYFEKADLARQFGDWKTVSDLGDQATDLEYGPGDSYEWIPFIEGYIHEQEWDKAIYLTQATFNNDHLYQPALCAAWSRSLNDVDVVNEAAAQLLSSIGCSK